MKTAIFIERDGILDLPRIEGDEQVAPTTLAEFKINPDAAAFCQNLKNAGFVLIVTTNQPGLSQGTLSRREVDRMHAALREALPVDDILVCPHDPEDGCSCHKPSPGLFLEASFKWHLDMEHSFVVSDKWQDAQVAREIGSTSMLLDSPWVGTDHHDFVLANLSAIAGKILQQSRRMAA